MPDWGLDGQIEISVAACVLAQVGFCASQLEFAQVHARVLWLRITYQVDNINFIVQEDI